MGMWKGWGDEEGGGGRGESHVVPLGVTVEARLNGASASKVRFAATHDRGRSITVAWLGDT